MMIEKWALFSFSHPNGAYRGRFSFVPSFSVGLSKWLPAKPLSGTHINLRSLDHNFKIQIEFSVHNMIRKKALC